MARARFVYLPFWKLEGAGNDFIAIDNRKRGLPEGPEREALLRALCDRRTGVGTDGAILLELPQDSTTAHIRMRYHNRDGGEAEMCGNGARCVALFAAVLGAAPRRGLRIETLAGLQRADVLRNGTVRLFLPDVAPLRHLQRITTTGWSGSLDFLRVGVPHAVLWVKDVERIDVESLGRALRHHKTFEPHGANVNFARVTRRSSRDTPNKKLVLVMLRTYERGVECETLACGTGSVATAISAVASGRAEPPVVIRVRGGVDLVIDLEPTPEGGARRVRLSGPARFVFAGVTRWDRREWKISLLER